MVDHQHTGNHNLIWNAVMITKLSIWSDRRIYPQLEKFPKNSAIRLAINLFQLAS